MNKFEFTYVHTCTCMRLCMCMCICMCMCLPMFPQKLFNHKWCIEVLNPYHLSAEPLGVAGFCRICIAETLSACALEADLITAYGNLFILCPSCQLHRPSSEP